MGLILLAYHVPRTYNSRAVPRLGTRQREVYDRATTGMRRFLTALLLLGAVIVLYSVLTEVLLASGAIRNTVLLGMCTEIVSRGAL